MCGGEGGYDGGELEGQIHTDISVEVKGDMMEVSYRVKYTQI